MTEPGSTPRSGLRENRACPVWISSVSGLELESFSGEQLKLDFGDSLPSQESNTTLLPLFNCFREAQPTNSIAPDTCCQPDGELCTDSEQLRSLLHEQLERIHHLEQALDQSLTFLEELRLQLIDQQFLESQLASTEEIANVQQQAIVQLKHQLAQQQQELESKQSQTQKLDQTFQEILGTIEELAQGQQTKLVSLRTRLQSDRAEIQNQKNSLEQQIIDLQANLSADQNHLVATNCHSIQPLTLPESLLEESNQVHGSAQDLFPQFSDREAAIAQLETELHRAHIVLQEQQALIETLQQAQAIRLATSNSPLDGEIFTAHCKIQELETQISRQTTNQAMLQHACQELEQARDRHHHRVMELESQTAEMQEQILQQAQQASEYETAIQHWKDRYLNSQIGLKNLKALVEQAVPNPSPELAELIATIQSMTDASEDHSNHLAPRIVKMDIPDFLVRRQRYRVRS